MKDKKELVAGFAARVREARERAGMSQADLAAKVGMHGQTVSDIEREYRGVSLKQGVDIAAALGVPLHALLTDREADDPVTLVRTLKGLIERHGREVIKGMVDIL